MKGGSLTELKGMSGETLTLTGYPQVNSVKQGSRLVMLMGAGGVVEPGPGSGLSFDVASDTLTVARLAEHAWAGPVNAQGQELREVEILGGSITGMASIESVGGLAVGENLEVEGDAAVGGHMVVSGTVMGSGPYVDSSDARFKTDVRDLFSSQPYVNGSSTSTSTISTSSAVGPSSKDESGLRGAGGGSGSGSGSGSDSGSGARGRRSGLETISQLRPVRYAFKREEFPDRHFPEGEDVGFLAQELEGVLPELVTTGADGFKYVAYAKLTPVLASGVQELLAEARRLDAENAALRRRVAALEDEQRAKAEDAARLSGRLERIEAMMLGSVGEGGGGSGSEGKQEVPR